MAKFLEAPVKPKTVQAIQYTGVENGAPTFNESIPSWIVGPMVRNRLTMVDGVLVLDEFAVPVGAWLMVDDRDDAGHTIRFAPAEHFFGAFRPARKKPVRKSKVALNVAAE